MKKIKNILIILIIALIAICILPQSEVEAETVSGIVGKISPASVPQNNYSGLQTVIGTILGFLQVASGLTSVIMIAFLGFKLLTETPEVKGQVKERFLPIIIGLVVVFGAVSISRFVIGVVA